MEKYTRIKLSFADCDCDIITFYDNVFNKWKETLSEEEKKTVSNEHIIYDCSKIIVADNIYYVIRSYYEKAFPDKYTLFSFNAHWCNIGPKATDNIKEYLHLDWETTNERPTLDDFEVIVFSDWLIPDE